MAAMKEHGICFTAPMVRAILSGAKTQTRRPVKPQPRWNGTLWEWDRKPPMLLPGPDGKPVAITMLRTKSEGYLRHVIAYRPPHQVGDRLWVRETWWRGAGPTWGSHCVVYDTDKAFGWSPGSGFDHYDLREFRKRSSRCMPRWASRITLEVTGVRVQRLQEITEDDAVAEGARNITDFHITWDTIYNVRELDWCVNPWVWVYGFKVLEVP